LLSFFPAEPAPALRFFPFFFIGAGEQFFCRNYIVSKLPTSGCQSLLTGTVFPSRKKTNKKSKSVEERLPAVRNFHWWAIYQMTLEKP